MPLHSPVSGADRLLLGSGLEGFVKVSSQFITLREPDNQPKAEDDALRLRCGRIFLSVPAGAVTSLNDGDLALVRRLATSPPLTAQTDTAFQTELLERWFATEVPTAGVLLAAMTTMQAHDLPPPPPFSAVPGWLREIWLSFLLRNPPLFRRVGERERYAERALAVIERVYDAVVTDPLPEAQRLGEQFRNEARMEALYFTDGDPTAAFRRWAEIIEVTALRVGLPVSHGFAPTARPRPRVGLLLNSLYAGPEPLYLIAHLSPELGRRFDVTLFLLTEVVDPGLRETVERTGVRIVHVPRGAVNTRVAWIRAHDLDLMLFASNCAVYGESTFLSMCRLARVQVTGAASPVSPGFTQHDYYLLGEDNVGPDYAQHCTETLYRLPGLCTYYAFGLDQSPGSVSVGRDDLQIPHDAPIFISTANYMKINAELVQLWARILCRVPKAVLLLAPFNPNWRPNYQEDILEDLLRVQMRACGVDPARVRIVRRLPQRADVQRLIGIADVYLDSFPFGGACSMIDPLEVGVPVVVRDAPNFRGSIAACMLRDIGLGDMVARDEEAYVEAAVRLGSSAPAQETARRRIRASAATNRAFTDCTAYAGRFLDACQMMIDGYAERFRRRMAEPARTRSALTDLVARLAAGRSPWLNTLSDTKLIPLLLLPYFKALGDVEGGRLLVDVGACVGDFARPFLLDGWSGHMLEPDASCEASLSALTAEFSGRAHHHAMVAVDAPVNSVTYHRTAVGLSGLGPSPYAPTLQTVVLPATRLADLARSEGMSRIDLLKVDAEGFDFTVLNGHDFAALPPRLVMVEFGDMYAGQSRAEIAEGIRAMAERGYDAMIFSCEDDGNFRKGVWEYRVIAVTFEEPRPNKAGAVFGNIIFFRRDDALLPALLLGLVESFLPGGERGSGG